ncbi:hypothetical protein BSKO_09588 [Bryopsis sp. KO-2023]|nr:hypothetical protein BSKO_09588 [Bryopsis sp. KO-2023]
MPKSRPPKKKSQSDTRKPRHSNDPNRPNKDVAPGMRSAATVRRLQMYRAKPVRTKQGKMVYQQYQSKALPNTRITPDRRWFGNTRTIGQKQLEQFRDAMRVKVDDAFTVLLREKKLPLQLLKEAGPKAETAGKGEGLLQVEPFEEVFGPSKKRKRPKLPSDTYGDLLNKIDERSEAYSEKLLKGGDRDLVKEDDGLRDSGRDSLFSKGQSKRIWGELYKVIDSSDVIIEVLDARDPEGTRSRHLESNLRKNHKHKHLILLLNKCDLVPAWVTKRWLHSLSREFPTVAFHAHINKPFGKGALLSILRQLARLRSDKKSISVGFVGYPNVGKSSVINTLKRKKVCNVAPIPGETKVWQYVTLIKRINLIDCPGVVHSTTDDTQTSTVLKGVVRVEHLEDATEYVPALLSRVKPEYITRAYCVKTWTDYEDFLAQVARRSGKLLKGGDPDLNTVARMVLLDWQKGRIPYFTLPPNYKETLPVGEVDGVAKEEDESDLPPGEAEVKLANRAQRAITDISVQVAEQIGDAIPQKRGYFTTEDAYENGVIGANVDVSSSGSESDQEDQTLSGKDGGNESDAEEEEEELEEEGGNGESDTDSDGYGAEGLSWEAVVASMNQVEEEEEEEDEEQPSAKRSKKNG